MESLYTWGITAAVAVVMAWVLLRPQILHEYERGVVYVLGRFSRVKGPGLLLVPLHRSIVKVDLRVITMDVPEQNVISQDNVSVNVNAVVYYRVVDPQMAINNVEDFHKATSELGQTTLRSVLGKHSLDEMLSEREKLNNDIQQILDEHTDKWGIEIGNVEIKHVDIDDSMVRAIAQQAEAERSRRAKVIHAEGELQAAKNLVKAAEQMGKDARSMQLRYLQTLSDISQENAKTIVFPVPMDILEQLTGAMSDVSSKNR